MFGFVFYSMDHCGGLDESLKTRVEISANQFMYFTRKYDYAFYCYDDRIHSLRFCKKKFDEGDDNPIWLLIEIKFLGGSHE